MNPPEALKTVLHYANAHPTEATWRRIVLGPSAKLILSPGQKPPEQKTFGIASRSELDPILAEFRKVLAQWVKLESTFSAAAEPLLQMTIDRSRLVFEGWLLGAESGQLVEHWNTKEKTFSEYLYSMLLLALREVPYRSIHRCEDCEKFFYDASKRAVKYCSKTCLNRTMARRYRDRGRVRTGSPRRTAVEKRRTGDQGREAPR